MTIRVISFPDPKILLHKYRVVCCNRRCQALLEYTDDEPAYDNEGDYYIKCPLCKSDVNVRYSIKVEETDIVYDESCERVTLHKSGKVVYCYKSGDCVEFFGVDGVQLHIVDALKLVRIPDHNMNEIYDKCAKLLGLQPTLRSKLP